MREMYTVTDADFHGDPERGIKPKNYRWIAWATEIGLKPGDKWNALDYMEWVDSHYKTP